MKTLAMIVFATAAMLPALSVGWVAIHGLTIHHDGVIAINCLFGSCQSAP